MEVSVKILEINPKSEEIIRYFSHIFVDLQTFIASTLSRTAMLCLQHL